MLKVEISFCIFSILSVYSENMLKVFKRLWRTRGKYFSAHEEYDEVWVVCGTQNCLRISGIFKLIRKICRKYLSVYGEKQKESRRILLMRQET